MKRQKRLLIITLLLLVGQLCIRESAYGQISLYYEDFGVFFYPQKQIDTLSFDVTQNYPGCTLKLFLKDYGGECYFELYSQKHRLRMTGYFVNGPDTLVRYRYAKDLGFPHNKSHHSITKVKYLAPLKKGMFTFYDDHGKVKAKYEYDYSFY